MRTRDRSYWPTADVEGDVTSAPVDVVQRSTPSTWTRIARLLSGGSDAAPSEKKSNAPKPSAADLHQHSWADGTPCRFRLNRILMGDDD
jgi:hypothetical protein